MTAVRKEEETKEMGKIIGICISEKRGTAKHEVETAKLVEDWGIEGDAHAVSVWAMAYPNCSGTPSTVCTPLCVWWCHRS